MHMVAISMMAAMAMNMDVLPTARRARPVIVDGPSAIEHERKRRHDR